MLYAFLSNYLHTLLYVLRKSLMTGCVGTNVRRLDGYDKVTGRTKYLDDIEIPGCWYGAILRSDIPYGKIKRIDFDKEFDWNQVVYCTHKDIPGKNATIFITEEQPILAEEYVRHVGEAIVLIAAPTKELAKEAKENIKVEYEELDPVLSIQNSKDKTNIIWGDDNIQSRYHIIKGDIEKGFKEADFIIEDEYKTGFHEHAYIEPQAIAAMPRDDGGITVMGSAQCPFYVLKTLKAVLDCDETKVNVVQTPMGGAFGGKEDYPSLLGSYAALLTLKSKKPVKFAYERDEDILVTTKRHPSIVKHKTGVKKDGTITAMDIDVALEGGAYTTVSQVVLSRGVIHSAGAYKCENTESKANCYATNNVPTGAYRGFGAPQVFFALESHIDKVAEKIGMNPLEFRLKNCVHLGDTLSTTQVLRESVAAEECLIAAAKATDFEKKWKKYNSQRRTHDAERTTKKGIGLSLYMHGGAFTGSGESIMKTEAALRLEKDGRVTILTGCTDMGQGSTTVLPQIAADALGIDVNQISCATPDTSKVPDSGPTVASRTTMIIGWVLEKCAKGIAETLINFVATKMDLEKDTLTISDGKIIKDKKEVASFKDAANDYLKTNGELKIIERYKLPSYIKWDAEKHLGDAYPAYSWAVDIAEVSVDTETFEVTVDKFTVAVDLGKAINPVLVEGQMEGGSLQAIGWGTIEEGIYDNGRPLNNRFQTYMIPTVMDAPKWNTIIIEDPFSAGPRGAKGIGELPHDGAAPAVANAIYNAIGIRVNELPIKPETLYCSSVVPSLSRDEVENQ